jgi:hypothetical protein
MFVGVVVLLGNEMSFSPPVVSHLKYNDIEYSGIV